MSRLRLAAGCALLKLAQEPNFTEFISLEQFQLIALLINVSSASIVESVPRYQCAGPLSVCFP